MFHLVYFSVQPLKELILSFLSQQVYLAPALLLFIEEAGVPLSLADFIIAYTGYHIALGHISFMVAFFSLLLADLLGASVLFLLSRKYGHTIVTKFGKYINVDFEKLHSLEKYYRKYGPLIIIVGRHIIGLRIPSIIFAGLSHMNYFVFIGSTFISVSIWMYIYLTLGMRLGPGTVRMLHAHSLDFLFFLLPLIISVTPFLFLRKKKKN